MSKKLSGVKVTTPKFRANWAYILKPRPQRAEDVQANKKPQYSITCLFEKGQDLTVLKKAIIGAGAEAWGPNRKEWPKLKSTPFKDQGTALRTRKEGDGSEYLPDGYTPGAVMMEAKTYNIPGLVDQKLNKIINETDFYSGCYALAVVVFKAYEFKGFGITCYLQHVQKHSDGESLAGRTTAETEFTALDTPDESVGDIDLSGGNDLGDDLAGLA